VSRPWETISQSVRRRAAAANHRRFFLNNLFGKAAIGATISRLLENEGAWRRAFREGARQREILIWIRRNPLKSPNSDE
jgi:hypothetical protein